MEESQNYFDNFNCINVKAPSAVALLIKNLSNLDDVKFNDCILSLLSPLSEEKLEILKVVADNKKLSSRIKFLKTQIINFISRTLGELTNKIDTTKIDDSTNIQLMTLILKITRTALALLRFEDSDSNLSEDPLYKELFINLCNAFKKEPPYDFEAKSSLALAICALLPKDLKFYLNILKIAKNQDDKEQEKLSDIEILLLDLLPIKTCRVYLFFAILFTCGGGDKFNKDLYFEFAQDVVQMDFGSSELLNIGTAKVLQLLIRNLNERELKEFENLMELFPQIEFYLLANINSQIDLVKGVTRETLTYLAIIYQKTGDLKRIVTQYINQDDTKWIFISCIVKKAPASIFPILEHSPQIVTEILATNLMFTKLSVDIYINLMKYHHQNSLPNLSETWISPLFSPETSQKNWTIKRSIVHSIIKSKSPLIKLIIEYISNLKDSEYSLLAVETFKMANELGFEFPQNQSQRKDYEFKGLVSWNILESWIGHEDSQIRISAFSLLIDSKKSSEILTPKEIEMVKMCLKYNFVSQDPSFRQFFLSYFIRLMRRLKGGRNLLRRKAEEYSDFNKFENYDNFIVWIWKFLIFEGLFEGANFARRCQALNCLQQMVIILELDQKVSDNENVENSAVNTFRENYPELLYNSFNIDWLINDTFENNKIVLLDLFTRIPPQIGDFNAFFENTFSLLTNIRPPVSVTGRYLIQMLINTNRVCPLEMLEKIFNRVESLYEEILKKSILEVAVNTPFYGCFASLRLIISSLKSPSSPSRTYLKKLILLSFDINKVLFQILASPSPEGFLFPNCSGSGYGEGNDSVVRSINSQMLLVFSWRTMKEICTLLTEICSKYEIEGESPNALINLEDIEAIGSHLLYLLQNLMHRGVFEQVYVGFKNLADRLWSSKNLTLKNLPEKWLKKITDEEICDKSITRRSGGVPFIFQALLPPGNESFWIEKLFVEKSELNLRIHCINVLRSLFRNGDFSIAMMPFVPRGIILSLNALKSKNWTERNSGLMLFTSVIRRCFGPKLNLMSAHFFFKKYPSLYSILLEELKSLDEESSSEFTYYLLVLFSCFTPSGEIQDNFKLSIFVDLIKKFGANQDIFVRIMSGRALIPFLSTADEKMEFIFNAIENLKVTGNKNEFHGYLIQIEALLGNIPENPTKGNFNIEKINGSFKQILKEEILGRQHYLIFEQLASISAKLGSFNEVNSAFNLLKLKSNNFLPGNSGGCGGYEIAMRSLAKTRISLESLDSNGDAGELKEETIYSILNEGNSIYVQELCSHLINNHQEKYKNSPLINEMGIRRYLAEAEKFEFPGQSPYQEILLQFLSLGPITISPFTQQLSENLLELLLSKLITIECKKYAINILIQILFLNGIGGESARKALFELIINYSQPNYEDDLREEIAKALPALPFTKDSFSVLEEWKIWLIMMRICVDDNVFIRSELFSKLKGNFCELKSCHILLELFYTHFVHENPKEGAILLAALLVEDNSIQISSDDDTEERLFDKSEMNTYKEVETLINIFLEVLPKGIFHDFGDIPLSSFPEDLTKHLERPIGNIHSVSLKQYLTMYLTPFLAKKIIDNLF